nr:NADH dehydrogenase subunit 4 [Pachycrepoideus vindemmiae]
MMKFIMYIFMLNLCIMMWNMKFLMLILSMNIMIIMFLFMMMYNYNNYWIMLYSFMGIDMLSYSLILLTLWIMVNMLLVSLNVKNKKMFSLNLLVLMMSLLMCFISMNYFMFYLFFEISLIPTFILIMGWGYQSERLNASYYMLMYTLFASLPLFIYIMYLYNYINTLYFEFLFNEMYNYKFNMFIIYIIMIFSFLVKLPLFMFHMWLPKAHVEAPVSGSMILAGVMLKLGGYGLMRTLLMMLFFNYNYIIFSISLIGMLLMSILCLRQIDIKMMVAYSSVVHMMMMLMSLLTNSMWGFMGGLMMMLAHGLCSSAMFYMVNLFYERVKTRNIYMMKKLNLYKPILMMWWFMFCINNMASPISLNLMSEIMIINVLLNWTMNIMIMLMLSMYISAMYSLYMYIVMSHGKFNIYLNKLYNNNINNYIILLFHWIPLNLIILKLEIFM